MREGGVGCVILRLYHSLTVGRISGVRSSFPPFPAILSETLFSFSMVPTPVNLEDAD